MFFYTYQYIILYRHLFYGLHALKELNLEKNQLTTIANQGFSDLKELRIAKLSYNYLTLQQTFSDPEYGTKSPFYNCLYLEELYLANNNISEVLSDWILSDLRLRKLDLKYNNISVITVSKNTWKKCTLKLISKTDINAIDRFTRYL